MANMCWACVVVLHGRQHTHLGAIPEADEKPVVEVSTQRVKETKEHDTALDVSE